MTRRAKIVCTIGPATASEENVRALIDAGMNVARLNFSHGTHSDHKQVYDLIRASAAETGQPIGVLADLQGPKIRLGTFGEGPVEWRTGDTVRITIDDVVGTAERVSTTYTGLVDDAKPGDRLLVDDGRIGLTVTAVEDTDVVCEVTEGGHPSDHKGVSLPNMDVSVPAMSEKDIADLEFALELGVDFIAMSFVRSPADIDLAHQVMDRVGKGRVPVIAKLEKPEAVANLEAVVLAFDGIMVARGDLGVELALEQVPLVQKRAIQIARENAKPVIVATQMLDSMMENFQPTRAETSDVANAVLDGADAVMLSGETSVGRYPVESVKTMSRIVMAVEAESTAVPPLSHVPRTKRGVISYAARDIGERLNAKALVAFTQSGDTVRRLARLHTGLPLLAFTPLESVRCQLALTWGTTAQIVDPVASTDAMVRQVDQAMLAMPRYQPGDLVVVVAGSPPGTVGSTNLIRVHRLGEEDHA
ncbi:pyruvate kinase [Haloechinothrix sp. LS1_15]|uniref:pyruvate kinase n=1 Tax=Haloechinothrix sp. LS1_15 TaxID=2652248 RepID=UPI0029480F7E|nr:pyruvate kinase [Haloechinothrix sp. LS1_15]MDV6012930.1 pyruvate kinase [Haloechinothrix sp. LS1_15]